MEPVYRCDRCGKDVASCECTSIANPDGVRQSLVVHVCLQCGQMIRADGSCGFEKDWPAPRSVRCRYGGLALTARPQWRVGKALYRLESVNPLEKLEME